MKANRIAKDEDGADASDAIIILALLLGIMLVAIYIGRSLGGVGSTVSDWFGGVGESVQEWASDVSSGISSTFGGSSDINIDSATETTIQKMYALDNFIITANTTKNRYEAILTDARDNYKRYALSAIGEETSTTSYLFGESGERLFGRAQVKTFTISDEAMSRLEKLRVDETLTLQGENYTAKITAQGLVGTQAQYILEISTTT